MVEHIHIIILLVQTAIFVLPLLILIYKQGRKDQVLDNTVNDLNRLGAKVSDMQKNHNNAFSELKMQIDNINNNLTRVSTSIEFIAKAMEDVKNKERL